MKLHCTCGHDYVYDHRQTGKAFQCQSCQQPIVMPVFKALPPDKQLAYRQELQERTRDRYSQLYADKRELTEKMPVPVRKVLGNEDILFASRPAKIVLVLRMCLCAVMVVPLLAIAIAGMASGGEAGPFMIILPIIALLFTGVYLSWANQFYVITKNRTIVSCGIFNKAISVALNRHIQLISVNTGVIDYLIGLNSIEVSTAAHGGAGGIMLPFGLRKGSVELKYVDLDEVIRCYEHLSATA